MRSLLVNASQALCLTSIAVGVGCYSWPAGLITAGVLGAGLHLVHDLATAETPTPAEPIA